MVALTPLMVIGCLIPTTSPIKSSLNRDTAIALHPSSRKISFLFASSPVGMWSCKDLILSFTESGNGFVLPSTTHTLGAFP